MPWPANITRQFRLGAVKACVFIARVGTIARKFEAMITEDGGSHNASFGLYET